MAQDFHAAFGFGADERHIATADADGVAVAAIQGLNEKLEVSMQNAEIRSGELETRLEQKEAEIAQLQQRLAQLENILNSLTDSGIKRP